MTGKRYAILIASSQFPDEPELEDLRFPENDADAFNKVLLAKERGRFTETFVLKNEPHHEAVVRIHEVLRGVGKNDLVLVYYAGHGKLNTLGRLCLAMSNTRSDLLESTSVPIETVKSLMDISSCNKKILILDCCYSGAAGDVFARGGVRDQLQMVSGGKGTCLMTASTKFETALEREAEQHGVFTRHLIEGIRSGEADLNRDGLITMNELYAYVHDRVCGEGCQEPMIWSLKAKGELVIARSGKNPAEERRKRIRKLLFDLAREDILPDTILMQALSVLALAADEMTETQIRCNRLLGRLLDKRLMVGEFIIEWHQLSSANTEKKEPARTEVKKARAEKQPDTPKTEVRSPEVVKKPKETTVPPEPELTNSLGMKFVYIRPGTFMMGSPEDEPGRDDDEVLHEVMLTRGFYMQTTQVTQGQWKALMEKNPSRFEDGGENCPVENVSWDDVQQFIEKLNRKQGGIYRLPTEAEWEYACRAGTATALYSGPMNILGKSNAPALDPIAWYGGNSGVDYEGGYDSSDWPETQYKNSESGTHPVGLKQPNAWGLYDMIGNVYEWCQDWYGGYPSRPVTDPAGPSDGSSRVIRGGSWFHAALSCRAAYRSWVPPGYRRFSLGFRLVLLPGQQVR